MIGNRGTSAGFTIETRYGIEARREVERTTDCVRILLRDPFDRRARTSDDVDAERHEARDDHCPRGAQSFEGAPARIRCERERLRDEHEARVEVAIRSRSRLRDRRGAMGPSPG